MEAEVTLLGDTARDMKEAATCITFLDSHIVRPLEGL